MAFGTSLGTVEFFDSRSRNRVSILAFNLTGVIPGLNLAGTSRIGLPLVLALWVFVTYWAVDDARTSFDRLLSLGATVHQEPIERGPGYVTASVVDPFGIVLGVMANQHYLDMVEGRPTA